MATPHCRRVDAYGEEGAPKSAAGVRTVPISGQLIAVLKAWKLKSKFKQPDDLIFPNGEGNHIGHDNLIKRRFLPLFDRLEGAHKDDPNVPVATAPLQLARASPFRGVVLDRGRTCA